MESVFIALYQYFSRRRLIFLALIIVGGAVATYLATKIKLEEDISQSIPDENAQVALIINHSRLTNKIIVHLYSKDTIHTPDPETFTGFADDLSDSL